MREDVESLKRMLVELQDQRAPWEANWRDIATYALPDTEAFDTMLGTNPLSAIDSVALDPRGAYRSRNVYDETSLWAIDRLAAGIIALKTPESEKWHGVAPDDIFQTEFEDEEEEWSERLRDYLFDVRANPRSGFWLAHKIAIRSMCAYGVGIKFVDNYVGGGAKLPFAYRAVPLSEAYLRADYHGVVNGCMRLISRSPRQLAERFGVEKLSQDTQKRLTDVKMADKPIPVVHAVFNRDSMDIVGKLGNKAMPFSSCYFEPNVDHMIGTSGFQEFPYIVHHWSRTTNSPYAEGPVSLALAEIKSLNVLSKSALKAAQQQVNPPMATFSDGMNRLNLNPGKVNPGAVTEDGKLLAQPLITNNRPDFASEIIEAKKNQVREMLYLNLWQVLIESPQMTATEALIRSQEKGELLGPVGISLNEGLSHQVDREVAILIRKGAFSGESPLAPPETLAGRSIKVIYNSPLDRMRRMGELVGMQRLMEFIGPIAEMKPDVLDRFDFDEMLDAARAILGVPIKALKPATDEGVAQGREQMAQMQQMQTMLQMGQGAANVAKTAGEAGINMAGAVQGAQATPPIDPAAAIEQNMQAAGGMPPEALPPGVGNMMPGGDQ